MLSLHRFNKAIITTSKMFDECGQWRLSIVIY